MQNSREEILHAFCKVLERDNSLSRCCAVKALEKLNARDENSKKQLLKMLEDPHPDVRIDTAGVVGRMGISEAVRPLLHILENDPEGEMRIQAAAALGKIGSPEAAGSLIRCVEEEGYPHLDQDDEDDLDYSPCWEVQSESLKALGEIGDPRTADPLIAFLQNNEYEDLWESGFRVLAKLHNDKTRAFLLEQLKQGSRLVRRRASGALAELPGSELSPEVLNGLSNALTDLDPAVRVYAARALGGTQNPLVAVSLTMLLNDADAEVRNEAVGVLGKMRGKDILDRLHPLLEDPKAKRRIAEVLGDIGDPASAEPLSGLLDAKDEALLYEAVRALAKIDFSAPEDTVHKIAAILANEKADINLRMQAARTLGHLLKNTAPAEKETECHEKINKNKQQLVDPEQLLIAAVADEKERVRYAALSALIEMAPEKAVKRLLALLHGRGADGQKQDEKKPAAAAETEPGKGPEIAEELQELIQDKTPETSTLAAILAAAPQQEEIPPADELPEDTPRQKIKKSLRILAARLLGNIPEPGTQAVEALMEAADAADLDLSREALAALGRIGDKKALPVIVRGLDAEQRELRLQALEVLSGFGEISGSEQYADKLLRDPDPVIRQRAVQILGSGKGQALHDEDRDVCRAALQVLSEKDYDKEYGERIYSLIFQFSGELRTDAGAALRRVKDFAPASLLRAKLDDPEQEEDHWMCIDALGEMYYEL
ncbi:MAG: hypothetical protein GY862_31935 [Gammaproteobacteria bacterium]|nr:hypothetical protein [Gammaproteobacteria bacterium]